MCLLELASRLPGARVVLLEEGPLEAALKARGVATLVIPAPAHFHDASREGGLAQLGAAAAVPGLARQVAREAKTADVIVANSQKAFVVAALAGRLARKPVVWYLHDILSGEHFSRLNRSLGVYLANHHSRGVLANSEASLRAFRAAGGRAEVSIVYNGFSTEPFDAVSEAEVLALRRELGVEGAFVAGIFGRLSPWKGQNVFLQALAQTEQTRGLVVGDALFGEDAYAKKLRAEASELGLSERVQFLGFRRDVPALMKACDVVVHASTAPEPFGRVVVEGMLAGRPVVAAQAGGVTEILRHRETGLLTLPGDAGALASALTRLRTETGLRERLAAAGREYAETAFSHEEAVSALTDALETWLE